MNGILTVMKKEFARFFGDRRMIIMTLLPAILIYVVYSFMGTAMQDMFAADEDRISVAAGVNFAGSVGQVMLDTNANIMVIDIQPGDVENAKVALSNREHLSEHISGSAQPLVPDLILIFPPDFDRLVEEFDVRTSAGPAPNVEVYFNSTDPNSADAYRRMLAVLDAFESSLANKFDVNRGVPQADLATATDVTATILSSMLPMLLLVFLFSGCMGLAPESIAGEKERGTLATLLVTPLGRSQLAAGKILSLAVLSFLSGLVTALATILALPNMMGGDPDGMFDVGIYSTVDYIWLALVILSTVLLFVAAISIISAFAKTVKEANMAVMPLMILVMLVGISGMFGGATQESPVLYMLPIYGSVQSMSGIFAMDYSVTNIAISVISNLVFACIGGYALTKMFNSEKVMFSK